MSRFGKKHKFNFFGQSYKLRIVIQTNCLLVLFFSEFGKKYNLFKSKEAKFREIWHTFWNNKKITKIRQICLANRARGKEIMKEIRLRHELTEEDINKRNNEPLTEPDSSLKRVT
jgi:hypothetical protein